MGSAVGVDTNVLAHFIQIVRGQYDPFRDADGGLRAERRAASWVLRAVPCLAVPPSVLAEIERTADPTERPAPVRWRDALPLEILKCPVSTVAARAQWFHQFHGQNRDCRIVAEAEVGGLVILLTFDPTLRNRLGNRSPTLRVRFPTEYWGELMSARGKSRVEPRG